MRHRLPSVVHKSLTCERVLDAARREAISLDNPGFCIYCGEESEGHEPDAEWHECEFCGKDGVFGAAQLLLVGRLKI